MLKLSPRRTRAPRLVLAALAFGVSLEAGVLAAALPASASPVISHLVPPAGASVNIAAVSSADNREEVFYVPQNGSVQEKYFVEGVGWNTTQVAPPGSAAQFADIAAVARDRNSLTEKIDVFWISPSGSVEHSYYQVGSPWLRSPSLAPAGSASTLGSLAAVSRASNTWEIFWLSPNSDVQDAYHYDGGPSGSFALAGHSNSTPNLLRGHISAVSRAFNTMEVFWLGKDGSIQDHYFYDNVGWNQFSPSLYPEGSALALGSPSGAITAVSRAWNTLEIWWIGPDYSVHDAYWYQGGFWNTFVLSGPNSAETAISAATPKGLMDVFWRGLGTGSIQQASFGPPWTQTQVVPPGPPPQGGIAAVSRNANHLDVFYLTINGGIDEATL